MRKPFFSIITPVFNGESYIEQCIKSVIKQNASYEHLVIDGFSTDATPEILARYSSHLQFISEPDSGIYDAMNKGIEMAQGQYFYFLGADDELKDEDVLNKIHLVLSQDRPDMLMGNVIYDTGKFVKPRFDNTLLLHNSVHHQGTFYKKDLFNNFRYNNQLRLISDYELHLKIFLNKQNYRCIYVDVIVAYCADNGASRTADALFVLETNQIRKVYIKGFGKHLLKYLFKTKVTLIKFLGKKR